MTSAVIGNGKPSAICPLILPVARKPSSGNSPRATVPGMRGRADMPSAKKLLGSSGSYRGCTAMRWRQPSAANNTAIAMRRLPRNIDDLPRLQRLEKLPHFVELEFRIACLHDEKELVARGLIESLDVEDGVIRHRQAVEGEHAEHREEGGDEHGALERDRDPRRPRVVRPAADVERIADDVRVPAHEESAETAEETAGEDDGGHAGVRHADRLVQSVNGKRREGVHLRVARLARGGGRIEQLLRTVELRDDAVGAGEDSADGHQCPPPSPAVCASASGSIVRISKIEIIGRKRRKRASRKRKRPIEPMYIAQSQIVP